MNVSKPRAISCVIIVSLLVLFPVHGFGQASATAPAAKATKQQPSVFSPGIAVGQKVPAIKLKDQTGSKVSIAAVLETSPVALVLFRSASW